jgi:site-specific DNA recombinase
MTPTHTTRKGTKRYRYYVCSSAQKRGWATCPSKAIPAAEIECFVVEQIRCVGRDPALVQEMLSQARQQGASRAVELEAERRGLEWDLARWHAEMQQVSGQLGTNEDHAVVIGRLADLQERISQAERRLAGVRDQLQALRAEFVAEEEAARALGGRWLATCRPSRICTKR